MKRSINFLRLTSIFTLLFFACSDDMDNQNFDPETISELMEDLYLKMYTTETGGTQSHDDFGHKGYDIFSDLLVGDMAISTATTTWSNYDANHLYSSITNYQSTLDFTNNDNYKTWTHYYSVIEAANTIIDFFGGDSVNPENETNRHYFGQALAMRAHSYFYLTQYMSNDYDSAAEILPIYREVYNLDLAKSTTAEVFELIESDLNRAIVLLENYDRPTKKQVNQSVAQAILAYTIAAQRDVSRMSEVVGLCDAVILGSGATLMNYSEVTSGFNNVETAGWIWGVDITPDMGLSLASWWGQMDAFSFSYAWAGDNRTIDQNLYDSIDDDDIRKVQFFNGPGYYNLMPLEKFYDSDRIVGGTSEIIKADYIFMRIAELYLLKAESLAKMGQDGSARTTLGEVLLERIPDISYLSSLSGSALEDEIYLQTRIEFWGEGKTYLALKRNERITGVRGSNHLSFVGESFAHNDERLTFEIPQSEIDNNPFINDQN